MVIKTPIEESSQGGEDESDEEESYEGSDEVKKPVKPVFKIWKQLPIFKISKPINKLPEPVKV